MSAQENKREHTTNLFISPREKQIALLKTAVIYGANASGKTNLLRAIETLRSMILDSSGYKLDENIKTYQPYLLDTTTKQAPSRFEIEFINQDLIRYLYKVEFDISEIIFEELSYFPKRQEALLFSREKGNIFKFGAQLSGKKQAIAGEVLKNVLFLSKAANTGHADEKLKEVYRYFRENLIFQIKESIPITDLAYHTNRQIEDKDFREKVITFLKAADTGTLDIRLDDNFRGFTGAIGAPTEVMEQLQNATKRPQVGHQVYCSEKPVELHFFDLTDQSAGTAKMYYLAGKIIHTLEQGRTLLIDELDSSFHPLISQYIFSLFNNPETNPHNAQLIVTTHDTSLLNVEIFRRDQIWFTEKNRYGATELYSLDEFKKNEVRKNIPFDKWYLNGRFGALPEVKGDLLSISSNPKKEHA